MTAVGFVGLGTMGSALTARLLAAGWDVAGCDIDPARVAAHRARGGTVAGSPAGAAAHADVAVTSLPSADALAEVAAGLAAHPRPGLVVIETSTLPVAVKQQAREVLAERGTVLLDCPLSGTGGQALAGDVVAYLSGPAGRRPARCRYCAR